MKIRSVSLKQVIPGLIRNAETRIHSEQIRNDKNKGKNWLSLA